MRDTLPVAKATEIKAVDWLHDTVGGLPARDHSAALTGALYAIVRVMHAKRPKSMKPEAFALTVMASVSSAASQLEPSDELAAAGSDEEAFLQLMGETACRLVHAVADGLHKQGATGPCCPMGGIVPGVIAGATFVAAEAFKHAGHVDMAELRTEIIGVVDEALKEAAEDGATSEVAGHA